MISKHERFGNTVLLLIFAAGVIIPIADFILAALSPNAAGIPDLSKIRWQNFVDAWNVAGLAQAMRVSLSVAVLAVAGEVLLAILGGYAFGVLGVAGSKVLFPTIMLGMMISTEAIIVPLYYQFRDLGMTNSIPGVALIHIGMSVPFGVLWMRAAFRALPVSLFESAELDGCGSIRKLFKIGLPLIRPAVVTLVLLDFMWAWNDYFISMVFLHGANETATVALGVFQAQYTTQINLMAAGGLIIAAPVLILYIFFQREFVNGLLQGAVKG